MNYLEFQGYQEVSWIFHSTNHWCIIHQRDLIYPKSLKYLRLLRGNLNRGWMVFELHRLVCPQVRVYWPRVWFMTSMFHTWQWTIFIALRCLLPPAPLVCCYHWAGPTGGCHSGCSLVGMLGTWSQFSYVMRKGETKMCRAPGPGAQLFLRKKRRDDPFL